MFTCGTEIVSSSKIKKVFYSLQDAESRRDGERDLRKRFGRKPSLGKYTFQVSKYFNVHDTLFFFYKNYINQT